jgi:repressor LexA
MSMGLTAKQRAALDFIAAYIAQHRVPPTLAEIRDHLGCRSKSQVHALLAALKERGHIDFLARRARSITLIEHDSGAATAFLPPRLRAGLAAFCAQHGEAPLSVIAAAVALHLDSVQVRATRAARAGP